jgi:hypothetical protein
VRAMSVLGAGAALLSLSLTAEAGENGTANAAAALRPAAAQALGSPMLASGHGAGGGSIFWPTGVPYGPIYSYSHRTWHSIGTRRFRNRVNYR